MAAKSKVKVLADSVCGEGPLPSLQMAVFLMCPHMGEREISSSLPALCCLTEALPIVQMPLNRPDSLAQDPGAVCGRASLEPSAYSKTSSLSGRTTESSERPECAGPRTDSMGLLTLNSTCSGASGLHGTCPSWPTHLSRNTSD